MSLSADIKSILYNSIYSGMKGKSYERQRTGINKMSEAGGGVIGSQKTSMISELSIMLLISGATSST